MKHKFLLAILLPAALLPAALAGAAALAGQAHGPSIGQRGRMFSAAAIRVQRGETVTFVNDDTVPHNVMSATSGNDFDMGAQMPGTAIPVSFDAAGLVDVICAIHPRMRMTVQVVD